MKTTFNSRCRFAGIENAYDVTIETSKYRFFSSIEFINRRFFLMGLSWSYFYSSKYISLYLGLCRIDFSLFNKAKEEESRLLDQVDKVFPNGE